MLFWNLFVNRFWFNICRSEYVEPYILQWLRIPNLTQKMIIINNKYHFPHTVFRELYNYLSLPISMNQLGAFYKTYTTRWFRRTECHIIKFASRNIWDVLSVIILRQLMTFTWILLLTTRKSTRVLLNKVVIFYFFSKAKSLCLFFFEPLCCGAIYRTTPRLEKKICIIVY